ncbi:peptide transporter family 1-like [Culicoides brevitarsis]|uniref:peptide transporter family 1-like n=1 Tax=Culicoides brevitarsis TaxID=469753 RepID=UPI00307B2813
MGEEVEIKKDGGKEDPESKAKAIRYPRAVPFILGNEFCERFNFYGMRTILALYLVQKLNYSEDSATVIFHLFTTVYYFLCIFGAIVSDSYWGKFRTIITLSLVYIAGNLTVTAGAVPPWNLPGRTFTFLGLALISLGGGGIKPCVAPFGGDQFKLPEQAKQLAWFFSIYYFAINFGSFVSTIVTPILRDDVQCFGDQDCFALGFLVPALLMTVSFLVFWSGKSLYVMKPLEGNMMAKVSGAVWNAIKAKWNSKEKKDHWLDHSEAKYGKRLIDETKILLNVLVLFVPLPFFWALFDQQGSRWTFQATRMEGDIGFYYVKPDQAQLLNPLMILIFIPLYEVAFYPLLNLLGVKRPLQKLTLGMVFAAVAFMISFGLEWELMKTYPVLPKSNEGHVRLYNTMPCNYKVEGYGNETFDLNKLNLSPNMIAESNEKLTLKFSTTTSGCNSFSQQIVFNDLEARGYFLTGSPSNPSVVNFLDNPDKTKNGNPRLRLLSNVAKNHEVVIEGERRVEWKAQNTSNFDVPKGGYAIKVNGKEIDFMDFKIGGVYAILLLETNGNEFETELVTVSEPNSISILWIIPQYFVMTLGEVMFSVTGISFSFDEAPQSMKSVLNGCWQLTSAFGNIIIVIIAELPLFGEQVWEFLLFAVIMFIDSALFAWLAYRYKSIPHGEEETEELHEKKEIHENAGFVDSDDADSQETTKL